VCVIFHRYTRSGCFSVGSCINGKRVPWHKIWDWKTLPMFQLSSSVFFREKVKNTSTFIAVHYWGYVIECHWRSKVRDNCSSLSPRQCGSATGISSPLSLLKHSSAGVICMCRASLCSSFPCPLTLSSTDVSSQLMGWWFSLACSATTNFYIIPLSQHRKLAI